MTADLIDSEDLDQLRHEILRLRDQAIGAEVQGQYLRMRVTELEDRIVERDARIEEWKDRVLERDSRIAEREARIASLEKENLTLGKNVARRVFRRLTRRLAGGSRRAAQSG